MAREVGVGEQLRLAGQDAGGAGQWIEARSRIDTTDGPLEVVARCRGDRWAVRASCAGREGDGLGADLGVALLAALELCDAQAEELD